ncbi:MAG: hypothetical protein TREMPRED_005681 [Tremellales sp. Tagirdzhanova-0007]|nr:MAG: hypothetical protein TREMPRED_005681 [Tremellales sp. Tagirdzhanova-0007]
MSSAHSRSDTSDDNRAETFDDQGAMIAAIYDLVSAAPDLKLKLPAIAFDAVDLGPSSMQRALRAGLPLIVQSLKRTNDMSGNVSKALETLGAALLFLTSQQYEDDRIERMRGNQAFRNVLRAELEALKNEDDEAAIQSEQSRKTRNTLLERRVHYVVNKLVLREHRQSGMVVESDLKDWPEPTDSMKAQVQVGSRTVEVWRPDWSNEHLCEGFVKAVIGTLSGEFKEDCPEEEIRVCLSGYMAWISKRQKRGDDNGVDREKSSRNVKSRSKQLAVALVVGLDTSLVNLCREREMLKAAVRSNALGFTLWAQDDEHGLPKDLGSSLDDSFVPFDTFQVLRDRFIEKKGDHGDAFAGRDVTWWSPKLRLAFWVLYEETRPIPPKRPRLPVFHLPLSHHTPVSIESLPRLQTSLTTDAPLSKKQKTAQSAQLTRGMVHPQVLDTPELQKWATNLGNDPALSAQDAVLPTLEALLEMSGNEDLGERVQAHLAVPIEIEEESLRQLWALRVEKPKQEYEEALRRSNSGEEFGTGENA